MDESIKSFGTDTKTALQKLSAVLPAAPALIFIAGMAVELFRCLTAYNTYFNDIVSITRLAVAAGAPAIALRLFGHRPGGGMERDVLNNPTVPCFSAMVILMLLSTLRNGFTMEALYGDFYRCESLFSFIIYLTIYYFASSLVDSERVKRVLLNSFLTLSALITVVTLLQIIAVKSGLPVPSSLLFFRTIKRSTGIVGIYSNENHYGFVLALSALLSGTLFVCAVKRLARALYLALFILFTVVLVLNDTFGAYLAVFAALLFLIIFFLVRDKKLQPGTVFLLAVFLAVSHVTAPGRTWNNFSVLFFDILHILGYSSGPVNGSVLSATVDVNRAGTNRWRLWKATVPMILERPLLGYGVEGIAARLTAEAGNDRPHNEFLQYAAFFGIPALLCYLGALFSVWRNFWKRRHTAPACTIAAFTAAFGYLVSSCFGNTMYYTAPLFFIVLGLADACPPKDTAGS